VISGCSPSPPETPCFYCSKKVYTLFICCCSSVHCLPLSQSLALIQCISMVRKMQIKEEDMDNNDDLAGDAIESDDKEEQVPAERPPKTSKFIA
ncbi:hypothetical protein ABKV19_020844, partial [Rosa sericea]